MKEYIAQNAHTVGDTNGRVSGVRPFTGPARSTCTPGPVATAPRCCTKTKKQRTIAWIDYAWMFHSISVGNRSRRSMAQPVSSTPRFSSILVFHTPLLFVKRRVLLGTTLIIISSSAELWRPQPFSSLVTSVFAAVNLWHRDRA